MKKLHCATLICILAAALAGMSILFSACGYHMEGGGYLDNNITNVAVRGFENKSSETGAGLTFTNALVKEILQKTDTGVIDESAADYIIKGRIKAVTFSTLSRSTTDSVLEKRVSVIVDLKIINKDGDTVWSIKDFLTDEDYTASDDEVTDTEGKHKALDKIAMRNAERLVSKMLNDF